MLAVGATLVAVVEATDRLGHDVDDALSVAVGASARDVAAYAKRNHRFENRTGRLEASIHAVSPEGRFMAGTLHADVVADAPYAGIVDSLVTARGAWAYLGPALDAMSAAVVRRVDDALSMAANRAGG